MEVDWKSVVACVVIASALVGLALGKLDAKDFITCVGLVLSFLSGYAVGYRFGKRERQ